MRIAEYRQGELGITEHVVAAPLDHARPDGERIEVFAREIVRRDRVNASVPRLLFLQGGPGNKAPRPLSNTGWLARALRDYRVVLLDQRGTGRSSPVNRQTIRRRGGPEEQAAYLGLFRADSIVADAEVLRDELQGGEPWSVLGQSFGGFCALTYLSFAPHGLREAFITGGLPPLSGTADDVYRITYDRVREKNAVLFDRYPGDQEICQRVVAELGRREVRLPSGEPLTPRRFQILGNALGMRGGPAELHYLLEEAFIEGMDGPELSDVFLGTVGRMASFGAAPLFGVVHEICYGQGAAARWAAERAYAQRPEFAIGEHQPFLFTGEMIFPFQFEEDPALVPFRDAAWLLAERDDWPALYDADRLARNEVPAYAAIYHDDMYVVREHSTRTAAAIRRLTPWITNEYEHDGLRETPDVLDRLLRMSTGAS